LTHQQDALELIEGDDRDRTGVAADLAARARSIGPLDRVDAERQVVALVEDLRIDDPLLERVGRLARTGPTAQAGTC
jgi:hypothetical protein